LTRRRARRAVRVVALLLASACASTYYDEYRSQHPGFEADAPREGADLEEVLAALHAPNRVETIDVRIERLEIARVDREPWVDLRFEAVRSGAFRSSDEDSYAVLVTWQCRFEEGLREERDARTGYYLLPGNRLGPRDHYGFRDRCSRRNEFVAARRELVPLEREAMRRVALRSGATRLELGQAFRRGLAYVEAGRLADASAMLVVGEQGYRAATSRLVVGQTAPESVREATRLRNNLMRALGVEAR
jgi:hypothetical protein